MKRFLNLRRNSLLLTTGIFSLALAGTAMGQEAAPEKARALLDQVKKSELDRQINARVTEIDRLKQDEEKTQQDAGSLQQTMDSNAQLVAESSESLTKLLTERRHLEHDLEVAEARINAERLKIEGLHALSAAQGKSLTALNLHVEEADARMRVRAAELDLLHSGRPVPGEGSEEKAQADLARGRKALTLAQGKTQSEERLSRDAMKAAATKMALAEARAATARRLSEIDPDAPAPVAEKAKSTKSEKAAERNETETPVRRAQPVNAPTAAPATPKPNGAPR